MKFKSEGMVEGKATGWRQRDVWEAPGRYLSGRRCQSLNDYIRGNCSKKWV